MGKTGGHKERFEKMQKYKKQKNGKYVAAVWDGTYNKDGTKHRKYLYSSKSSKDLEKKVAAYALPKEIIFRDSLPKTLVGKVDCHALEEEAQRYTTPYDWTKLDRSNGRYAYVVDGQVKSRLGIDVSESQESIDWQAVADDGIEFAMIRLGYRGATEGDLYLDDYFEENFAGAREAGLDCGVYFFSQAVNPDEAVEEAQFVLDQLGGAQLEYPIAFDSEVVSGVAGARTQFLTREEMTAVADAFCTHLEMAGYRTLVYGNAGDLSRYSDEVVNDGGIWWAEYNAPQPAHYLDIVMWQYANEGSVAGIGTGVDMNIDLSGVL